MIIYCTGCEKDIDARLTSGREIYPHRADLHNLPFWKCDNCKNYVGCHHRTKTPTRSLGCIATAELLDARKKIHALLDPLWRSKKIKRGQAYSYVTSRMAKIMNDPTYQYHNGEIRTLEEAREVYRLVAALHNALIDA